MKKKLKYLLLLFSLLLYPLFLYGNNNIILNSNMEIFSIVENVKFFEDKEGNVNIDDIILNEKNNTQKYYWKENKKKILTFGYTSSVYWLKFNIVNKFAKNINWHLEIAYPHLDLINLYQVIDGKYKETKFGDKYSFSKRKIKYRNFIINNYTPKNRSVVYFLKVKTTSSMILPLYISSPKKTYEKNSTEYMILGFYFGIILIMAMYNLFIYISIKDISYLFYVLWVIGYGLYQFSVNGLAYQYLWNESPNWASISLPFFISFGTTFGLLFGKSFLNTKKSTPIMNKIILVLSFITCLNMVLSFFLPYMIIIRIAIVIVIVMVVVLLMSGFVALYRDYKIAKFYIIAWFTLLLGVTVFALKTLGVLSSNFFTEWSQQIGSTIEVVFLSFALADKMKKSEKEKRKVQKESNKLANRHKVVVEGANEIIFVLDESCKILSVNKVVKNYFNVSPESLIDKNFIDMIYDDANESGFSREIVQNKLNEFLNSKETTSFRADFISAISTEPKEMNVHLEYIDIGGKVEILGKAFSFGQDSLLKYFEFEKQRLSISNHLIKVDDVAYRITRNLIKYIDNKEIKLIKIALREIIVNAIEHGNLNITYDEKTDAILNDNYFEFIAKRRKDSRYIDRKVNIVFSIDAEKFMVKITDDGEGFDHSKVLGDNESANKEMLSHGRGISMTKNIFDKIQYNKKGNQVLLVKQFEKNS